MRIASVDIGSNTVILLVCEYNSGKLITLKNEYRIPRISKGLSETGEISKEKIEELKIILSEYLSIISQYKCAHLLINATAAFRKAANSQLIIDECKYLLGINIQVISGETEAKYSFLGALLSSKNENNVVIDIGGGSTEVIYGNKEGILFSKSHPVGAVNLTEIFVKEYPIDDNVVAELSNHIDIVFSSLTTNFNNFGIIAVAGTPTSLFCMIKNEKIYSDLFVNNGIITLGDLITISSLLQKSIPDEILRQYGNVVEGRNDVIYTGSLLLLKLLQKFNKDSLLVSTTGIRYGAIVSFLEEKELKISEHIYNL